MLRKIFKTGNCLMVSFPADMLEALDVDEGDDVFVELDLERSQIVIRPMGGLRMAGSDAAFARQASEFFEQQRPILEALAGN
jgi:antitoxin component of MazEF toxin-antitoxin module